MKGFIRPRSGAALIWLAAVVTCAALAGGALAQEPFSSLHFGIAGGSDVGGGRFQELWTSSPSVDFVVRLPFHLGQAGAAISAARYSFTGDPPPQVEEPDPSNRPLADGADFLGALMQVGWGPNFSIAPNFDVYGSVTAGNFLMLFDSPRQGYAQRENELVLGTSMGMTLYAVRQVGVFTRFSFARVFTSTPMDIVQVSAGLETRLSTPGWFRAMLR